MIVSSPRVSPALLALSLAAVSAPLHAEAGNPLTDRFSVSLGGFLMNTSTEIRVDGEGRRGTEINLEEDLGLGDTDRFRIDAYWRMTPRQKLRLMYFDTTRSRRQVIDQEIEFGDETFPVNIEVETEFKTQVMALSYEFDFLHTDKYELGVTGGIHNLKFSLGLSAEGNGQQVALDESAQANGPLPLIGIHGVWRFSEKWYLDAGAQFFKIKYDPYDGRLTDFTASVVWQPWEHVGFGAGWNEFVTRLDVDGDNFNGHLRWRYGGARIFVIASF